MPRVLFIVILYLLPFTFALGQTGPEGRLLNAVELAKEKTYYSMEEALADSDHVYKLSLSGQKLKKLPPEIAKLKKLQWLNLSENRLTTLPPEIGQLSNLEFLSVFDNKLRVIPLEIANLGNLRAFYLGKNYLTEMPVWIGGLRKLTRMDLSANRFTPLEIQYIRNAMPPRVDLTF